MAGTLEWHGDAFIADARRKAVDAMNHATDDGAKAGKAAVRHIDTGQYRDGWRGVDAEVRGDVVHGEIVNDAARNGEFYSRWPSAGTSRMQGDFAHAAAVDTATVRLVGYLEEEFR